MNTNKKVMITLGSIVFASLLLFGAQLLAKKTPSVQKKITASELAAADGKGAHDCFVAVDGIVYKIFTSPLWVNGQHTTSQGMAYCGADMSLVIDKAPHGRSKLAQLQKIGTLE
jgi:predicted heme/steroid binding protein